MTKYALFERHIGKICWAGEAESPLDAATKYEHPTGLDHCVILPPGTEHGEDWTYAVHELPDDFNVDAIDGNDEKVLRRVRACPIVDYVGLVR